MNTTYLMNTYTGSVDTEENWAADGYTTDSSDLIEVVQNANGDWIEAV